PESTECDAYLLLNRQRYGGECAQSNFRRSRRSAVRFSGCAIRNNKTLFAICNLIGLVGFEPTASWSRTRRSTKLSHSPKWIKHATMPNRRARYFAYVAADSKEIEPSRCKQV